MTQKVPNDSQVESLMKRIQTLEVTCLKLEAERDAHMEVIKQLFGYILNPPDDLFLAQLKEHEISSGS